MPGGREARLKAAIRAGESGVVADVGSGGAAWCTDLAQLICLRVFACRGDRGKEGIGDH